MDVASRHDDAGAGQWSRAREILDDMKHQRAALAARHLQRPSFSHDSPIASPTAATKLTTINEYEASESDRARDILDTMKKRRESFSHMLVGVASPTSTKQSVTRTESTADLSWVSTSSEGDEPETYLYSEEEESNCYDDYCYYTDKDNGSSITSSDSSESDQYTSETSKLLSAISEQDESTVEVLVDLRDMEIPTPGVARFGSVEPSDEQEALERKTINTSEARTLYRDGATSAQQGSTGFKQQLLTDSDSTSSFHYLKWEHHGPATSRLRADLQAITQRRSMLTNMLESVSRLREDQGYGYDACSQSVGASTISTTPGESQRRNITRPPRQGYASKYTVRSRAEHASPLLQTEAAAAFFGYWSGRDPQPEKEAKSFGWPISELVWSGSRSKGSLTFDASDFVEWDESGDIISRELAESRRAQDRDGLPNQIVIKVKDTKPKRTEYPEAPYRTVEESFCGGLYHIVKLTDRMADTAKKVELTNSSADSTKKETPTGMEIAVGKGRHEFRASDYLMPYNVEDRFCGGLYQMSSQLHPRSGKALI